MTSHLSRFLQESANSVSREVLFAHRVTYELKLGSALSGWDLRVYRPDVDRDGFDLLIEQASVARFLQLKTVQHRAATRRWKVRTHLLHPSTRRSGRLRFRLPALGLGDGLDGGVVLTDFSVVNESVDVTFRFFDLAVAAAHVCELTAGVRARARARDAAKFLESVRKANGRGSVIIPASMFIRVPTAEGLLSLLGMRTRYRGSWAYNTLRAYAMRFGGEVSPDKVSLNEAMKLSRDALTEVQAGEPASAA
jgi:hypothetical protein